MSSNITVAKPPLSLSKQMSLNTYLKDQQIYASLGQGEDVEGRFHNEKPQVCNIFLNSHTLFIPINF